MTAYLRPFTFANNDSVLNTWPRTSVKFLIAATLVKQNEKKFKAWDTMRASKDRLGSESHIYDETT